MALVSVITCSHNPRPDYLQRVIDALKNQSLDKSHWEFLLVDNASTEPLAPRVDLCWHPHARHVREETLGLTHARLRGIRQSAADLLVFVDDDNVLDPDFLEQALDIAREWPRLGSWSGQTRVGFESPPPEWTKRYWGNLVIRSLDADLWSNLPHLPDTMPCGAGLCVRRNVAEHYLLLHESGKRNFVLDRTGSSLLSAGDNDLAACACDVGLGVGLFVALSLTHLIPESRLEEDYLLRLVESIAYSGVIFRSFRGTTSPQLAFGGKIGSIARQLFLGSRDRRFFRAYRRGELRALRQLKNTSSSNISQTKTSDELSASLLR